jgi:hypothetical protein
VTMASASARPGGHHKEDRGLDDVSEGSVPPGSVSRENFLFIPSRPALRAASGRPPARQQHDAHRGTGLTLQDGGAEATRRIAGAHLGHEPSETAVTRG